MSTVLDRFHQVGEQLRALHDLEIEEQQARIVLLRCANLRTLIAAEIKLTEQTMLRLAADQLYLVQGEQARVRHDAEQHRRRSGQLRREQVAR